MKIETVSDWKQLTEIIERSGHIRYGHAIGRNYIQYRGQSNHEWKLDSSLKRVVNIDNMDEEKACKYELQAQRQYLSQSHLIGEKLAFKEGMNPLGVFLDMQHFSCPTRVLDWSASPYVALYFAVNENIHCDGSFFIWTSPLYFEAVYAKYPDVKPKDITDVPKFRAFPFVQLVFAKSMNERIVRQQGTFTMSNYILSSYCDIIDMATSWGKDSGLYKYIIPKALKLQFLARLKAMNISASSLFHGMDGLGRSLKEALLIRGWAESQALKVQN